MSRCISKLIYFKNKATNNLGWREYLTTFNLHLLQLCGVANLHLFFAKPDHLLALASL